MVFISTKHFTIKTRKTFTKPFSNINLVLFSSGCFSGSRRSFYLVERDCSISMSRPSTSRSPPSNYPSTHWNSSIHLPHFDYFSFVMIFRKSLPFRLASLEAEKKADMFLTFKTHSICFKEIICCWITQCSAIFHLHQPILHHHQLYFILNEAKALSLVSYRIFTNFTFLFHSPGVAASTAIWWWWWWRTTIASLSFFLIFTII